MQKKDLTSQMCMRCTIFKEMNDYVKVGQKVLRRNKGGVARNASESTGDNVLSETSAETSADLLLLNVVIENMERVGREGQSKRK